MLIENKDEIVDFETFFLAFQSIIDISGDLRFIICVDEIDSVIKNALTEEDARAILYILYRMLTDPDLPVRLLLTASDAEVIRQYPQGADFLADLGIWNIPLCSESQTRDLIKRFDVPITFEDEALSRIYQYSGGQIYFIKLAIKASLAQANEEDGKKIINKQLVDELMQAVIEPASSTTFEIRNLHDTIFPTMNNIYEKHFSDNEQDFLCLLVKANGVLRASSLEVSEENLLSASNFLFRRDYIFKTEDDQGEVYSWRIGLWKLFLENLYQFKYCKSQEQQ